jgi:hypothetical protein
MNRSQIALTASFVVGGLVWALAPLVTEKREAWDSGFYHGTVIVASFVIALVCFKWKEVIGGLFFGQLLYLVSFPRALSGGEPNFIVLLLALVMCLLAPSVSALAGWAIRWLVMRVAARNRDEL